MAQKAGLQSYVEAEFETKSDYAVDYDRFKYNILSSLTDRGTAYVGTLSAYFEV